MRSFLNGFHANRPLSSGVVNEDGTNLTFVNEDKVYSLNLETISENPSISGEVFNEHGAILTLGIDL